MMTGAAVTAAMVTGLYTNTGVGGSSGSEGGAPKTISNSISEAIDRLSLHLRHNITDSGFLNICITLSRFIDFAIVNHEVPSRSQELPSLIKQVYQIKNDTLLLAALMVLMISVKSACQNGWFSDGDSIELSYLAKEIASNFCSVSDFKAEPSSSISVISTIMSRFYPRMKMGHIFVSLEIKPGFDAYVCDFQILKNLKSSPGDKIRLFVVQTNSIETSSCLITPSKVNFLLNGKGVEKRSAPFVDAGPQIPTIVKPMLKYGSNLLQAVGEFNGNYIITVACMSELPSPDSNTLQDYVHHAPATVDADSEVIVESSRISLNCPISFRRIKIPVKGHSCKHIQCFDFDNYVNINSRRPSWRCPQCNQHVCFTDIRIDQKMVKALQEVGPNVSDVIICPDGSWNAVTENEETVENPEENTLNTGQNESRQPADVLDLTHTDDAMDAVSTYETEYRKHSSTAHEPQMSKTNDVDQSSGQVDSDFWSGLYMSTFGLGPSNVQPSEQAAGISLTSSILTESFTSPDREVEAFHQSGNPSTTNEYGRFPPIPGHITRTPTAVLSLPAQIPSVFQRSSTNGLNSFIPNGLSVASQTSPTASNLTTFANPRQQNSPFPSARSPHQNAGFLDPNQVPNMNRISNEHHGSTQQMANFRVHRATSQSPGMIQSSSESLGSFLRPQTVHRTGVASAQQSHLIAAANRAVQMSIDASRTTPLFSWNPDGSSMATPPGGDQRDISGATSQPVNYDPADLSWRSVGRMRGALSGQAYDDAYNQFIGRPYAHAQAARPIANVISRPTNVQPQVQSSMSSATVLGIPKPNFVSPVPVGRPMGLDVLPGGSSGMQ